MNVGEPGDVLEDGDRIEELGLVEADFSENGRKVLCGGGPLEERLERPKVVGPDPERCSSVTTGSPHSECD